ncbi:hypothetical protein CGZ93_03110 [Enemella dayhoffiae]|uniref:Winged helix DNA-binding domain-containing protein n=1 Tax=Enemella dayhoffiae TaxID=2016507 RepID=A0A255HAP5_9ACTN|nr:crosslink repair DNA glycosylase YcaQ family protein [Enemella dayhoffiae]OYO24697.1 hypothetical protein CGZ93_03110 [Enemella dayhoffiae]
MSCTTWTSANRNWNRSTATRSSPGSTCGPDRPRTDHGPARAGAATPLPDPGTRRDRRRPDRAGGARPWCPARGRRGRADGPGEPRGVRPRRPAVDRRLLRGVGSGLGVAGRPALLPAHRSARRADRALPFSGADAGKRCGTAGRKLEDCIEALTSVATEQRAVLGKPLSKGEVSTLLQGRLPDELQVACRSCAVTHYHEQLFRLAAVHGGLELQPGTSPPVLRRIPGWRRTPGPAADATRAPKHLQVARAYLHLLGPATPKEVAAFCETSVGEIKAVWPEDAVEVDRAGTTAWLLPEDDDAYQAAAEPAAEPALRLLNGFDLFLAAKDRDLLTGGNQARHKELWPTLGRPGAIARDGELLGTWRPRSKKERLTIACSWWGRPGATIRRQAEAAAELLAAAGGQEFAGLD